MKATPTNLPSDSMLHRGNSFFKSKIAQTLIAGYKV